MLVRALCRLEPLQLQRVHRSVHSFCFYRQECNCRQLLMSATSHSVSFVRGLLSFGDQVASAPAYRLSNASSSVAYASRFLTVPQNRQGCTELQVNILGLRKLLALKYLPQ